MSDNSTAVSPSNLTSPSPIDFFKLTGGTWFRVVSGLIDHALGIPANVWSLYVIVNSGGRIVESEIITLNLVALEIGSSLNIILMMINLFIIKSISMYNWLVFPFSVGVSGRSLFQCLICLERYLAVVHPVIFLRYKPLRYRLSCCGLVWLLAVGYGGIIISLFFQGDVTIALLVLFIPLLSIDLFCSLSILRVLRQPGPGDGGREKKDVGKEKDREEDGENGRERKDGGRLEDRQEDGENGRQKDGGKEEQQKARARERGTVKEGERAAERGRERLREERKNQQKRRAFRIVSFMMGMLVLNIVPLTMCAPLKKVFGVQVYVYEVQPVLHSLFQIGSCVTALLYLHRAGRLPCLTPTTRGSQQNH